MAEEVRKLRERRQVEQMQLRADRVHFFQLFQAALMVFSHLKRQHVEREMLAGIVIDDRGNRTAHRSEVIIVHAKGNVEGGFAIAADGLRCLRCLHCLQIHGLIHWFIHCMAFMTCSTLTALTQSPRLGAVMTVLLARSIGTHSGFFWRISAITGTCTALARCITAVSTEMIRSQHSSTAGSWKKFSSALNSSVRSSW